MVNTKHTEYECRFCVCGITCFSFAVADDDVMMDVDTADDPNAQQQQQQQQQQLKKRRRVSRSSVVTSLMTRCCTMLNAVVSDACKQHDREEREKPQRQQIRSRVRGKDVQNLHNPNPSYSPAPLLLAPPLVTLFISP